MTQLGTMQGGVIVPDDAAAWPDGTRIAFEPATDLTSDFGPPTDSYDEHLAKLRESVAAMKAGVPSKPLAEFAAELKQQFGVSPDNEE